jgi:alpha-tubulin suppressor-like RCC1 family protein
VQVGSLTNWLNVAGGTYHISAIKTDGTLWTWGRGQAGALGVGDTEDRSSPTQVGALTNWYISSSSTQFSYSIKTDGTLWAWGRNAYYGQLGLGNTTDRSSPVQVGALTNWTNISTGTIHGLAISTG